MKQSGSFTQVTHVHRTTVFRVDKTSQPVNNASSASFVQACYNALNRAITILLLLRQQLERIDLVVMSHSSKGAACALNTFASLALTPSCTPYPVGRSPFVLVAHHQRQCFFFLLFAVPVSRGYSPNVVIQGETVAMRANVRQSDSSQSVDSCDDPPQEVSAFSQDLLLRCPNGQCHPLQLSHKLREFFQKFAYIVFPPSQILPNNPQLPRFIARYARRVVW